MTQTQYIRTVAITAGVPGQPGRRWTGLKINGSVQKTDTSKPNTGTVQLYNLTPDSVGFLRQPGAVIKFTVGYDGETSVIFVGDVDEVTSKRDGSSRVVEIKARDGQVAYQTATLNRSWRPPLNSSQLLRRLADATGLQLLELPTNLDVIDYQSGYVCVGPVRDAFTEVCASLDATWSIQDGVLVITKFGSATSESAALVSPATGLVGYPEATKHGVKFVSLLNPLVKPRRFVRLDSEEFRAFYLVKRVTHRFDSRDGDFYTEAEAVELD